MRWAVLLFALVCGCVNAADVVQTAVRVTVDADEQVQERATTVDITILSGVGGRSTWTESYTKMLRPPIAWPFDFMLVPQGDNASRGFEVIIAARDQDGEFSRVRAISSFVEGKVLTLSLLLDRACIDFSITCRASQTCVETADGTATCVDAEVDAVDLVDDAESDASPEGGNDSDSSGGDDSGNNSSNSSSNNSSSNNGSTGVNTVPDSGIDDAAMDSAMKDSALPTNIVRCQVGVDCDQVAFDCGPCNDGVGCTTDYCEVNTDTLAITCPHEPLTDGLCQDGMHVDVTDRCDLEEPNPDGGVPLPRHILYVYSDDTSECVLLAEKKALQAYCCDGGSGTTGYLGTTCATNADHPSCTQIWP